MNVAPPRWRGYLPAVVTPFDRRLRVDYGAFVEILDWLVDEGMHGLAVAGTTGEWSSLTAAERERLVVAARARLPAQRPLLAGCSALTPRECRRHLKRAHAAGADAALLTLPPYVCPSLAEAETFFLRLADDSPLPLVVYNWPRGTGIDLPPHTLVRLASHPAIIGIKNSTGDRGAFRSTLAALSARSLVFGIMPGTEGLRLLQEVGGAGCIGAAGVLGRRQPGFFDAAFAGDHERARRLGRFDEQLMASCFDGFCGRFAHAISTFKCLLSLRGLPAGTVRPPLLPVEPGQARMIAQAAESAGLFDNA